MSNSIGDAADAAAGLSSETETSATDDGWKPCLVEARETIANLRTRPGSMKSCSTRGMGHRANRLA